jgi:DNA-binding transcriptional LysR family regulator
VIDLRHVRHLLAVASHSTVQAAAEALHITQPALTKSNARFEEVLEAKLFDRRGRRLVLTELGERLVERGDDLMRHVRELEEEVALWKGIGTGEVAIGVDPEAELSLLPRVLEAFVPAHPGVQVTLRSGHTDALLPNLLGGDLHFIVADSEFALERDDLPLAGASTAPRFERWSSQRIRREGAVPLVPALVCDNYEVLVRLAESSDTIVFGPRTLLAAYERAGRLKVMSWSLEGPETSPSVIRSKGRQISPAAEQLIALFTG